MAFHHLLQSLAGRDQWPDVDRHWKAWRDTFTAAAPRRPPAQLVAGPRPPPPRIGIGGAEAQPRRIAAAEAVLAGRKPDDESFRAAAEAAADAVEPMEDIHADAEFRLDLVRAVTRRALERAQA